jgi:hypothetical protein
LIVLVVNFSAAPSETEFARAKATIADNLRFIRLKIHTYLRWSDFIEKYPRVQCFGRLKYLGKLPEESPPLFHKKVL